MLLRPGWQCCKVLRLLVVGHSAFAVSAAGQSVRGVVTDMRTGGPAFGSVVTLERTESAEAAGVEVRSVLTDEQGRFAIGAPGAGTYAVIVRRIGSRPFRAGPFPLAAAETRRFEFRLEPVRPDVTDAFTLTRVTVAGATPCETARDHAMRIASLWNDARTALHATLIAQRDSLVRRRVVRYERVLDPSTLAILGEQVRAFDAVGGTSGGFFRSVSGDSLSRRGYWERLGPGVARFHGPDENALLSDAFLIDHCFTLTSDAARRGLLGLGFEPAAHRRGGDAPPDIRGTIWLDSATSELRSLEFAWTTLPPGVEPDHLGGQVDYTRLAWGPWYVHRWWLRMPEGLSAGRSAGPRFGIVEEGGLVQTGAETARQSAPARITGTLVDGSETPLAGAFVTVSGTGRRVVTDARGRFALDEVPPGLQVVVAEHGRYEALGVRAAEVDVLLDEGRHRELSLRAPSDAEIPARLCGESSANGRGALRLVVVDAATGRPVSALRVTLAERNAGAIGSGFLSASATDDRGAVLFCGAPSEELLTVTAGAGSRSVTFELALPAGGLKSRVVRLAGR